jgi:hypothetical protein
MYQEVYLHDFREAFKHLGRESQFSYEGLEVLFNGLEQYEADTGESIKLDVIALCCEYSESDQEEIRNSYEVDEEESIEDFLIENTWYLGSHITDGKKFYIYQSF